MKNILIVDDAPTVVKIINYALSADGHNVDTAADADEAMECVRCRKYDVGVFDVNMPGRDGIELTRDVLATDNGRNMKIIMLTTESSNEMRQKGRDAGAKGWLLKPFNSEDLTNIIAKL